MIKVMMGGDGNVPLPAVDSVTDLGVLYDNNYSLVHISE